MSPSDSYFLRTFGCQMNDHDAERIRAVMEDLGYRRVAELEDADVLIYNTCTVRSSADERLAGHLGAAARAKRADRRRLVVLTGCLPQAEQESIFARFPFVDLALGPQNLHRLPDAIRRAVADRRHGLGEHHGFFEDTPRLSAELPSRRERPFQAWVQVMSGCTNFCSYCVVPYVRGPERSRPADDIVAEVRHLVADGVREVTLLGQNVNAYGGDLNLPSAGSSPRSPTSFAGLLVLLDTLTGIERIRFMTSHPKDLSPELIDAVAGLRTVCEHIHLPAQSGSDAVLHAMRRGYGRRDYLQRVTMLREAVPDVAVTTDLIVGFPGETEADFHDTLSLVREANFDAAFTFVYSPRERTAAATMAGQVADEVKRRRVRTLVESTQALAAERRRRFVGRRLEVLVEGPSRDGRRLRGRTRHNVTVNFEGAACPGQLVEVLITTATSTTLRGSM